MTEKTTPPAEAKLESWKAIAAYLNRDARTVMRWEQSEGLPIHRHQHLARSTVYAYPSELDAWQAGRKPDGKTADTDQAPPRRVSTRLMAAAAVALMTLLSAGGGRFMTADVNAASLPAGSLRKVAISASWNYAAGPVSADGRYLVYIDAAYALAIQDLVAGTDRELVRPLDTRRGPFPSSAVVSRDGRQVAYSWCYATGSEMTRVCELWTLALDNPEGSRRKLAGDTQTFFTPLDWLPDGRAVVARVWQGNGNRLGLVDAQTGALSALKSIDWCTSCRAVVSPDGLNIAYDNPASRTDDQRDVFVLSADASHEVSAVVGPGNDTLVGWTSDGRHLLFESDRRGRRELWSQRWADRRPSGAAEPLGEAPPGRLLGVSADGTLFSSENDASRTVEVATVDLETGRVIGTPVRLRSIGSFTSPTWSPDGMSMAYFTAHDDRRFVGILNLDTDETREIDVQAFAAMQGLTWSPDGRWLLVAGARDGRYGIYRLDATTGSAEPVVVPIDSDDQLSYEGFSWSPDGGRLYYHSQNGKIHERDETSGAIREVARGPLGPISLSPDGQWIATSLAADGGTPAALVLVSVTTGAVRELLRLEAGETINNVAMPWTTDGRAVVMRKMLASRGSELWVVPVDGVRPHRLELDANRIAGGAGGKMRLHPDGRRLAYVTGESRPQVWALENVLAGAR